jgi:hypothetical protein
MSVFKTNLQFYVMFCTNWLHLAKVGFLNKNKTNLYNFMIVYENFTHKINTITSTM